ncbi:MAG: SCO family protein, partial [Planctomycetota bacterium]
MPRRPASISRSVARPSGMARTVHLGGATAAFVAGLALAAPTLAEDAPAPAAVEAPIASQPAEPAATPSLPQRGLTDPAGRPIPQPPAAVAEPVPEAMEGVGVVEKLGDSIPTDLVFTDADGNTVALADFLDDGKPLLLNPIYYKCPMLCGLISQGLVSGVRHLQFTPGDEFTILTFSFNPEETPDLAEAHAEATFASLARPEARGGWHHLVGDAENTGRLLEAIGFTVKLQPDGEYAHPAAVAMVSPSGTITRYIVPTEPNSGFNTNTLRRAIVEAGEGTVGSPLDVIIQTCLQFNHATGRYELAMGTMRAGAVSTILVLAGSIGGMLWFERRRRGQQPPSDPPTQAPAGPPPPLPAPRATHPQRETTLSPRSRHP